MRPTRSPWLPVGLAGVQLVDAALCMRPVGFVAECLEDVKFPREYWPVLAPIKVVAAAGLLAGRRMPIVGFATCAGLVLYFGTAVGLHLRAHDLGRNFCNATGLLGASAIVGIRFFELQRQADDVVSSPTATGSAVASSVSTRILGRSSPVCT
ncbi:MAG: DoxX family protein [Nocardioidaceae bacterium]